MATCANCGHELQPTWKYCIMCGARTGVPLTESWSLDLRPDGLLVAEAPRRVNVLAVLALILGMLLSPLAALFGHLAVAQIRSSGDRGIVPAWIAVAL